jgi:hypothetical protein
MRETGDGPRLPSARDGIDQPHLGLTTPDPGKAQRVGAAVLHPYPGRKVPGVETPHHLGPCPVIRHQGIPEPDDEDTRGCVVACHVRDSRV